MKTETKTIYRCDHCNKIYFRKHFAVKHEKACFYNPDNHRICFSCVYLTKKDTTLFVENYYHNEEKEIKLFHCNKLESFLYPPTVEFKGNSFDSSDLENETSNIPMKRECSDFKSEHEADEIFFNDIINKIE